jgi:preprotein translocase subunit SecE
MADTKNRAVTEGGADEAPAPRRGFNPVRFWNEVVREMKKVTWPSWKETRLTTLMVFIMVALTTVFFFTVDSALSYGEQLLIGAKRLF